MQTPRPAVLFDDGKGLLAPMRDLRPIYDVRTGPLTIAERLTRALTLHPVAQFVPEGLAGLASASMAPVNDLDRSTGPLLLINGRCAMPIEAVAHLGEGSILVEQSSGDVVAANLDAADAMTLFEHIYAGGPEPGFETAAIEEDVLLTRPWDVRRIRDLSIELDLDLLAGNPVAPLPEGVVSIGLTTARVHPTAKLYPTCILNTEGGPVVIDRDATIRPGAIIMGPAYIGPGTMVFEGAQIRPKTALGPVCKVSGEIAGTVMQGYSNKAHDGHLGDSWLGEWVNLGAATTVSNLLNTYGEVTSTAEPGGSREQTGETFFGCVLGDHVKTAIGTRIMTGAIVHTGAMWADPAPMVGAIERFCWATDQARLKYKLERFLNTARIVMARRRIEMGGRYEARIRALHSGEG
ncbi:MAG: putative sugar nucleotidyl transferase [Planctomycetota bacterium]